MWNILKQSSSRTLRRHERGREIPRSGIESLERRECPTVVFGLESGVLSITGDDRANVIEVSEPREGLVQVVGDGVTRTFRGVNQVVIDAKGGDDVLSVTMGATGNVNLVVNAGAGNDSISVFDGQPSGKFTHPDLYVNIWIDMGTGLDSLRVALNNSHNVGLDVLSADGGDVIEVGILFSICRHPNGASTVCGLRASLQLGGGDNDLDLRTEGPGNVDLELVAAGGGNSVKFVDTETAGGYIDEDLPPWCEIDLGFADGGNHVDLNTDSFFDITYRIDAVGGGNEVEINQGRILAGTDGGIWTSHTDLMLTGDENSVSFNTQGYNQVDLDLDLTGNSNTVVVGLLLPAVQNPLRGLSAARVNVDLDGVGNLLSLNSSNIDEMDLNVLAVGGGNSVSVKQNIFRIEFGGNLGATTTSHTNLMLTGDANKISFNTQGYDQVDLDLDLTGNSNTVAIGLLVPAVQKVREAAARARIDVNVGANSFVSVNSDGFVDVGLDLTSGGESQILIGLLLPAVQKVREAAARIDVNVGANSFVSVNSDGFDDVGLDLTSGGESQILIGLLLPAVQKCPPACYARVNLNVGANSFVDVSLENIDNVDLNIVSEPATRQSATGGVINVQWQNIKNGSGNAARDEMVKILTTSVADGSGVSRSDGVTPDSLSFSVRTGDPHTASAVNASLKFGNTRDTVSILTRFAGDLNPSIGGSTNDELTIRVFAQINTGGGNDTVVVDANAGKISDLIVDPRNRDSLFDINLDLGSGNDRAEVRIEGFSKPSLNLTAGEGDDVVLVRFKPLFAFTVHDLDGARLNVDLGAGNDVLDSDIRGFSKASARIDAGAGDDRIRHKMFSVVDRTQSNVDRARFDFFALLGEGSDTLLLETLGGRQIKTVIDSGPAGDGRDRISATHESLRRSGPVQRRRLAFDRGMDVYELLSIGYTVRINMISPIRQMTILQEL